MLQRPLGLSGLTVSCVGLGTVKFGRNQQVKYPQAFELPSDQAILTLLDKAKELGINFLDTAPAYGHSEERLGKLLKGQRQNWVIGTKVGEYFENGESRYDFSRETTVSSIQQSLRLLQTDYLDLVLIHSDGRDVEVIEDTPVFATLLELKQQGLIRTIGMSTKTVAGGLLALQHGDAVMVTHNPSYQEEREVIAKAHAMQRAVLIKKGLQSGHVGQIPGQDPIQTAMNCIFQEPGVTSIIVGTLSPTHLAHDVHCAEQALKEFAAP